METKTTEEQRLKHIEDCKEILRENLFLSDKFKNFTITKLNDCYFRLNRVTKRYKYKDNISHETWCLEYYLVDAELCKYDIFSHSFKQSIKSMFSNLINMY